MRAFLVGIALLGAFKPDIVRACSVGGKPASPKQIVASAQTIVLARAVGFDPGRRVGGTIEVETLGSLSSTTGMAPTELEILRSENPLALRTTWGSVAFEIVEVLKGPSGLVGQRTSLFGQIARYSGTDPSPREHAVPLLQSTRTLGGCFSTDYKIGNLFLLFLRSGGGLIEEPLAPVNEAVSDGADPWVAWVRREIQDSSLGERNPPGTRCGCTASGGSMPMARWPLVALLAVLGTVRSRQRPQRHPSPTDHCS